MGLGNCEKCNDSSRDCQCQTSTLPASIRREIEDFEVPWPEGNGDEWKSVVRAKGGGAKGGGADDVVGIVKNRDTEGWDDIGVRGIAIGKAPAAPEGVKSTKNKRESQWSTKRSTRSKVSFNLDDDDGGADGRSSVERISSSLDEEEISSVVDSGSYVVDKKSETLDSLLEKPDWMNYRE